MKKRLRVIASTLLLMLVSGGSSYGWSDTGHMAVAFVTYSHLTPQTRKRVDALIRLNPRFNLWLNKIPPGTSESTRRGMLFMIAATWADQIKGDGQHRPDGPDNGDQPPTDGTAARITGYSDMALHKYWHFIDLPFSPDGTPLHSPAIPNAGTQIPALRVVLGSTSSDPLKSYALVWLLHLVGDVHQPLHATSRFTHGLPKGDAGGNFITVCDPQCGGRLHAFWDGLLGTTSDPAAAIQVGQTLPVPPANLANNLNVATWINESFADAKTTVYAKPPIGIGSGPFPLTTSYRNAARTLAMRRVALAGVRLANILNSDLK